MNYSTAVMLINPDIRAIKGKYEDSGNADVFKTIDKDIAVDDYVVVESSTRWGLTVIKVTEVDIDIDFDSPKELRWVVHKINMLFHTKVREMEGKAIELIKKGELRKRREDIKKNTLDAYCAGELEGLEIAKMGHLSIDNKQEE